MPYDASNPEHVAAFLRGHWYDWMRDGYWTDIGLLIF